LPFDAAKTCSDRFRFLHVFVADYR
jgi:hypothetical protein